MEKFDMHGHRDSGFLVTQVPRPAKGSCNSGRGASQPQEAGTHHHAYGNSAVIRFSLFASKLDFELPQLRALT